MLWIDTERELVIVALWTVAVFYAVTIFFFVIANKSRMNSALAAQKAVWLLIIVGIAIPAYSGRPDDIPPERVRVSLWIALTVVTVWVLIEVYRANRGLIKQRVLRLIGIGPAEPTWPDIERRNGGDRRRQEG